MSNAPVAASPQQKRQLRLLPIGIALMVGFILTACNNSQSNTATSKPKGPKPHLVEILKVGKQSSNSTHERNGTLKARRVVRIHNQEEGRVRQAPYYEGDQVEAGTILVQLDDRLLKAEISKARATLKQATLDKKRISDLFKKRVASKDELTRANTALEVAEAELKLLETRLGFTTIRAPLDGVISERSMEPGDLAAKNSHLLTLTDPDSLVIQVHLSELLLPHLKLGDPVKITIDALGNRQFNGHILRIHPELDATTRQGIVEVTLDPIPAGARAGQFARVSLTTTRVERILIPFSAIRRDREGEFVYLMDEQHKAHRHGIRSGIRVGQEVEVLDGLSEDDLVVTRGFLGIAEGKQVTPVNLKPQG